MQLRSFRSLALLLGGVVSLGCADAVRPGTGQLTIHLTDAPFPFSEVSEVNVHIVRIDARQAFATEEEAEAAGNMAGWFTLLEPDATFNLLTLQNGNTVNLGTAALPAGTYHSFRIIIDTDQTSVLLTDGSEVDIKFPSAGQTGIKVLLTEPVEVSEGHSLMILDFDVGRSFVLRGNSIRNNGLLFKPVVRAVGTATGSVAGTVRAESETGDPVAEATVELLKAGTALEDDDPDNVVASTATDESGNFMFAFVAPGTYVLRVTPPEDSSLNAALLDGDVTVVANTAVTGLIVVLEE